MYMYMYSAIVLCTFVLQDEHFRTAALEKNVRLIVHVHIAVLDMVHPICNIMSHRMAVCIVICIVMRKSLYSCDHIFHLHTLILYVVVFVCRFQLSWACWGCGTTTSLVPRAMHCFPMTRSISWMSTYTCTRVHIR